MADDRQRRGGGRELQRADERMQSNFDPHGAHEPVTAHGEISEGLPPRQIGGAPGFGSHGMGYGPQGSGDAWGVYGVPRNVAQDYVDVSRSGSPGEFDQPHGRIGFGWEGAFGSEGEFSARSDRIRPAHGAVHGLEGSGGGRAEQDNPPRQRRGPKNYVRSDERIKDEIYERLTREQRIDASDVTIEVEGGTARLYGSVAHRQMMHWIEDIAADCHGVNDVENKLTVSLAAASPADRKEAPDSPF